MRRVVTAGFATLAGIAGAIACSGRIHAPVLPRAGAADDDGTGVLARWSRGLRPRTTCDESGCALAGDTYALGGAAYGGSLYGYPIPDTDDDLPAVPDPPSRPAPTNYSVLSPSTAITTGTVEGFITWKGARAAVPKSIANCQPPLPMISVVYLADISRGKPAATLGGVLELEPCAPVPHVQIAEPIGQNLSISNHDEIDHALGIRQVGQKSFVEHVIHTHQSTDVPLPASGIYEVREDVGHPAWVVVPRHPYYVITDENGYFRIDDIPPGEYTLVAWHEPVVSEGDPAEGRARVRVVTGTVATANIDLK